MSLADLTATQREIVKTAAKYFDSGDYRRDFEWFAGRSLGKEFEWGLVFESRDASTRRITGDFQRTDLLALHELGYITLNKMTDDKFICALKQKALDQYRSGQDTPDKTNTETRDFAFVSSADLRRICVRDYAETRICHEGGAYKAAMVMCGSVMEALLLDALEKREQQAKASTKAPKDKTGKVRDVDQWFLGHMIDVALDIGIIRKDAYSLMPDQLREYRNLVHPAAERRKGITPEEEEATASRSALNLVIKSLKSSP